MEIIKTINENIMEIALNGSLDTITAPQLEDELSNSLNGIEHLIFDFKDLEYISSAGLRVLFSAQTIMEEQGEMKVRNVNSEIMEIFELTGFVDVLTIEV